MGRYAALRLLQLIPVFFGATLLLYAMVYLIPGDPVRALFGERRVSENTLNEIRDRYNLDDPFLVQYGKYMGLSPTRKTASTGSCSWSSVRTSAAARSPTSSRNASRRRCGCR